MVVVTEGYSARYANNPHYLNELCPMLDANLVFIEHRFFGKSVPEPRDWQHLNAAQAARDHHEVIILLKQLYTSKWLSTGISKGGQTALIHRMFYPNDVDATVAYVAPVNFAVEEERHFHFIEEEVATRRDRKKVYKFQKQLLKKREEIMPYFRDRIENEELSFMVPLDEIYDLCVLEYSFAFWQWIGRPIKIPDSKASPQILYKHFAEVSDPDYFAIRPMDMFYPFFVQAAKELGYYAYNVEPFRKWTSIPNTDGYLDRVMLGPEVSFDYSPDLSLRLQAFLEKEARNILCIYGGLDPWTASGVKVAQREGFRILTSANGTHKTRILTLGDKQKAFAKKLLLSWLEG